MITRKTCYYSIFVNHSDMSTIEIFDNHMLASIQEVSITFSFLRHRRQRSVSHVAEIVLDTCPKYDFYFLITDTRKSIVQVSENARGV